MTEEKIAELQALLSRRTVLENEIEAFDRVFKEDRENLGFTIHDARASQNTSCLHFIKDHYGYMSEALWKIYVEYKNELADINKKIEDL